MFGGSIHSLPARMSATSKRGAECEDAADAGVLGEDAGEYEAEDLRGEDGGHDGGADAAHELGRGFLLDEGL